MNDFTKGPWLIGVDAYDARIKMVYANNLTNGPETQDIESIAFVKGSKAEANAKLIAAAPDLLAALLFAYAHCDPTKGREIEWQCIPNAIEKATGKAE